MLIKKILYKILAKFLYISYYIFHQVIKCLGEEDLDGVLDGMVMDGLTDGQHGQDGAEETHIHSAGDFLGCQEDGGACHIGQCIAIHITCHGGGNKCHLAWDHMDG